MRSIPKYVYIVLALLFLFSVIFILITCNANKQTSNKTSGPIIEEPKSKREVKAVGFEYNENKLTYELVWNDEFDYIGPPDPKKWEIETGGNGWGNRELQYYTKSDNVYVDGKKMVITARLEDVGGREVTSARLRTAKKGDWVYGKMEVCAKIPTGLGTWSAIWMLPTDWKYGGWPASGEIDIMEHVGYDTDALVMSIHTESYNHVKGTQKSKSVRKAGMTSDFHVYAIEWLPDKIKFFYEGELQYTYKPTTYKDSPTYKEWPFDRRFHLLINLAFGGNWGGARGVNYDALPVDYEIDYVRVYQSPEITALTKI
jgi:beta-glucanase (GH16 family)